MSLNVKNPETLRLIDALAERLGLTKTQAISEAVTARLQALRPRPTPESVLETIWADQTPAEKDAIQARSHGLYDDLGLYA